MLMAEFLNVVLPNSVLLNGVLLNGVLSCSTDVLVLGEEVVQDSQGRLEVQIHHI